METYREASGADLGQTLAPSWSSGGLAQAVEHVDRRHHLIAGRPVDAVALALEAPDRTGDLLGRRSDPTSTIDRRTREHQPLLGFGHGLPWRAGLIAARQRGIEPQIGGEYWPVSWPAGSGGVPTPTPAQGSAANTGDQPSEQAEGGEPFEPADPPPG